MARSGNSSIVPEAREALNRFKMEAANEVGVNLKQGYNGDQQTGWFRGRPDGQKDDPVLRKRHEIRFA